jgi:hypothetical protein
MKRATIILAFFILAIFSLGDFLTGQKKRGQEVPLYAQDKEGNRIDLYRESYALLIGIDHYTAGWPDLPGVAKDIEDVRKEVTKHGFIVTVARNLDRDKLISTLEGFISKFGRNPENRLLIYFAGHGHTIKLATEVEVGYIVPADAPNPNVNDQGFKDKAIDMYRFENFARQIECKHVLFVFDSCFSGSIFALSRGAVSEVISYKTARPVRQFITSGSADEMVPDKSIFKSQFVSGIEGEADTDKDGFVTGTELGEFLLKQVVNYSKGTQHPQYGKIRDPHLDKGDFVFIVKMPEPKKPGPSSEVEQEYWKSTTKFDSAEAYEAYLKKYPDGLFSDLARVALDRLKVNETEQQSWNSAANSDTAAAYQDYLKKYPKGNFANTARERLRALETEQQLWKSTTRLDTAAAYGDYLAKYPNGKFSDIARDKTNVIEAEQQLWSSAIKLDSTAAYEDYLEKYPKGIFANIARDKIKAIAAEQQIWDSADKSAIAAAYKDYLKKYPNGKFIDIARDKIKAIEAEQQIWNSAIKSNTVAAYQDYINKYPNGSFSEIARDKLKVNEAEQQLWSSTTKLDTAAAYADYLKQYPKGIFASIARDKMAEQQIWDSAVKLDTMAAYSEYGKKYPFGRYSKTAQERWTILRDRESIKNKDAETKAVLAVKLIQLPPEKIRLYNEKIKQLIVTEFPKEVKVQGQVNLTLSVSADGKISVEALNDAGLNVSPPEKRESVRQTIIAAVIAVILDPPKDRSGKSVNVGNWQVSYSCGVFQGKLVLSSIPI